MGFAGLAVIAAMVVAYGLTSRRLESSPLTGPMAFAVAGIVLGRSATGLLDVGVDQGVLRVVAEATLVLVLFTDAIRIDLRKLRHQLQLPGRLLGIGLPLTILTGVGVGRLVFPNAGLLEVALIAAILSPTDAALGQAVVKNHVVPLRIRQTINVESGLNDGLMLPVIVILLALGVAEMDRNPPGELIGFALRHIGGGLVAGAVIGYVGGRLIDRFATRGWMDGVHLQLATLAVGVGAFAAAEALGGNGFVAAFVAGLFFGHLARRHCAPAYAFAEEEGELLSLLTFLFFGATLAGPMLGSLTWQVGLYSLLSLTVIRMLPVAVSLIGTGLRLPTIGYLGWFGPRGLASIIFGLFVLGESDLPGADRILLVVTWTVLASIVLHGVSSVPLSDRYGAWAERTRAPQECMTVDTMPTR